MLLYPASAIFPADKTYIPLFQKRAAIDRFGTHALTSDPSRADIILFLDVNEHANDLSLSKVSRHSLSQKYREKTFLYNELDQPWCAMQGLFVSMPRRSFLFSRQRACGYLLQELNPHVSRSEAAESNLLFSFAGRNCHPVRRKVLRLRHSRALVEDTTDRGAFGENSNRDGEERQRWYADLLRRSKFVLCPRGAGTCSFRLFEAMATSRVPVVISDDWVPPEGPEWNRFCLFVKEKDVAGIPQLLESAEERFPAMSGLARLAWEEWFSPEVQFHRIVEACASISRDRRLPEAVSCRIPSARYWRLRLRRTKATLLNKIRRGRG